MQIERSRLVEILHQRGSERTVQAVEERLPGEVDTIRDSALIHQCGIDPNVLEALVTSALRGS
jgi:hypothetical protein